MKKWVCTVCGYVHTGDQPPKKCPQCKVPAEKFKEQVTNTTFAAEHVVGIPMPQSFAASSAPTANGSTGAMLILNRSPRMADGVPGGRSRRLGMVAVSLIVPSSFFA